jgi:hypothetical protein
MREEYERHLERTLRAFVGLVRKVEALKREWEAIDPRMGSVYEPELGEARGCMEEAFELMVQERSSGLGEV